MKTHTPFQIYYANLLQPCFILPVSQMSIVQPAFIPTLQCLKNSNYVNTWISIVFLFCIVFFHHCDFDQKVQAAVSAKLETHKALHEAEFCALKLELEDAKQELSTQKELNKQKSAQHKTLEREAKALARENQKLNKQLSKQQINHHAPSNHSDEASEEKLMRENLESLWESFRIGRDWYSFLK